jgi:hypothetical protein
VNLVKVRVFSGQKCPENGIGIKFKIFCNKIQEYKREHWSIFDDCLHK